ncbi:unnamed protein product [Protopolystoma xenopodis]|uniref:Uncharacterized protein n=1 Tax=Protopolystoma xenopodis TaxID=117903 RepID=A0A448X6J4_9PLAT|nr:unnamed protein product [Protopolystoma xenopodis]
MYNIFLATSKLVQNPVPIHLHTLHSEHKLIFLLPTAIGGIIIDQLGWQAVDGYGQPSQLTRLADGVSVSTQRGQLELIGLKPTDGVSRTEDAVKARCIAVVFFNQQDGGRKTLVYTSPYFGVYVSAADGSGSGVEREYKDGGYREFSS